MKTKISRASTRPNLLLAAPGSDASAVFRTLPTARRRQLARDLASIVAYVSRGSNQVAGSAQSVDFPTFVADLLNGVFDSILAASTQQMEAYLALLAEVAKTAEQFAKDNASAAAARDHLTNTFPDLDDTTAGGGDDPPSKPKKKRRARRTKAQTQASNARLLANFALKARAASSERK